MKAGRDRDKLISKLKGYSDNFHWSMSRNESWELWNELWESHEAMNYRQYTGMTGKECHEVIAEIKAGDRVHMAYGDTFADAVSQVWLLWKQAKGGQDETDKRSI